MARKTQISKEVILEHAFQLLLRNGYGAISISSLAQEIGCSTQPIAWHFGNMDGLRNELLTYSLDFLKNYFVFKEESVCEILEEISERYISLAMEYPNLYKYIYISDHEGEKMTQIAKSLRARNRDKLIRMIEQEYEVESEQAEEYMMNLQIYVHGMASFVVTKSSLDSKKIVMAMIHKANEMFLREMKKE